MYLTESHSNLTLTYMTSRQTSVPRGKHGDDPMVPLVPSHLRAAVELGRWTTAGLVARMGQGENRQTIHHLMQGDTSIRCRKSRRRKLAKLLDVPEEWLAGERMAFPLPGYGHLQIAERRSPLVQLAVARLMKRVLDATERDLRLFRTEPENPDDDFTSPRYEVVSVMSWAIGQITNPSEWQTKLLQSREARELTDVEKRWIATGVPPQLGEGIEPMSEAEQGAALSLVRAFEFILEPWFDNRAWLNYGVLEELTYAVMRGARALRPNSERPKAVVGPEGKRLKANHPWTPFAVIKWSHEASDRSIHRGK